MFGKPQFIGFVRLSLTAVLATCLLAASARAEEEESDKVSVETVLALGPIAWTGPIAWDEAKNVEAIKQNAALQLDRLPAAGESFEAFGQTHAWRRQETAKAAAGLADRDGVLLISFNMETHRYAPGALEVAWQGAIDLFHNGAPMAGSTEKGFSLKAENGSHRFLAMLRKAKDQEDFSLSIAWRSKYDAAFHIEPKRRLSPEQLYHTQTVEGMDISPDGKWAALGLRGYDSRQSQWVSWLEVRDAESGALWQRWRGSAPSGAWSRDGQKLAYTLNGDLWILDMATREERKLLSKLEGAGGFEWHPDGGSLLFTWRTVRAEPRKDGMKRYRALEDRWAGWRNRSQVFQVDIVSGWLRQLTDGDTSHGIADISPDGAKLLLSASPVDYAEPPHTTTVLLEMDLASGEKAELMRSRYINSANYWGDGLYITGGPSMFEGLGVATPPDMTPNEYDGQLYFYNLAAKRPEALSKSFDPSINSIEILGNGDLMLSAAKGDETRLYRYDSRRKAFSELDQPVRVVEGFAVSRGDNARLLWRGTSASTPQKVYTSPAARLSPRIFLDPAPEAYAQTRLGAVKDWRFKNRDGNEIDGRYYLPIDFDPAKKYPLIVYYYGGTVSVSEAFTGRYPFNLWASHGYVIYIPQPAGAVGYGQTFSAKHVNAWGKETAEDIIDGAKAFTAAHDFVDPDKIGIGGASYGGFMTMYLTTRTDMFAAAMSHAGISNLTSYWGKGWWGYLYSGTASRGSFPWNNRELYVEQSPIFSADKVNTPLLLLHGDADTNVPPTESHQMYTALKLLDKDVELIEVAGENHWIIDNGKRMVWWDTILAYYDKHLKDQPEWWNDLYPAD